MDSIREICIMFTGIVESIGIIKEMIVNGTNRTFWVESSLSSGLRIDQSVSHSGVCMTVEEINENRHRVTAIEETLGKTTLGTWIPGTPVNLERCLPINGRLDGHWVQGHVDAVGICRKKKENAGSWEFEFQYSKKFASLLIEKGPICVNGVSLTVYGVKKKSFRVAIIPYTFEHSNIKEICTGDKVNLEFDMIGKYIHRYLNSH